MAQVISIVSGALAGLLLMAPSSVSEEQRSQVVCEGKYKDGSSPTREELSRILKEHEQWSRSWGEKGRRPNLCKANLRELKLRGAILAGADLSGAILTGADLSRAHLGDIPKPANLRGAVLNGTNLSAAILARADLREASLHDANLSDAHLGSANLQGAFLDQANLSRANLVGANLVGANLEGANLSGANLFGADLAYSIFELKPGSLPAIDMLARAKNLSRMTFELSPLALVELREEFKKKGMRQQEREITFAIRHTERHRAWEAGLPGKIESIFHFVFFELTSLYGMAPGRPLLILAGLIPLFSIPYIVALPRRGRSGIWVVALADRVHRSRGRPFRVGANFPVGKSGPARTWWRFLMFGLRLVRIGVCFSLLSAFRIGWRELNVGNWITQLQCREYALRATGWVRAVSGFQSLISVYLVALWALTYFGRPFE